MAAQTKITKAQLTAAFKLASSELPSQYQLRGRGHAPRTALTTHASACAVKAISEGQWDKICGGPRFGPRRVFPVELVERAAAHLSIPPEELMAPSWR